MRQTIWLAHIGRKFEAKCKVSWCQSIITPFTFEAGHNVPESKGGATSVDNLIPICSTCNKSMGNRYTITEYSRLHIPQLQRKRRKLFCCLNEPEDRMDTT